MDGFDSKLCLREFWECLDETQRDSLLKINIKDDDDKIQCTACRPCYKAAVLALKEKATETISRDPNPVHMGNLGNNRHNLQVILASYNWKK